MSKRYKLSFLGRTIGTSDCSYSLHKKGLKLTGYRCSLKGTCVCFLDGVFQPKAWNDSQS